VAERAASIRVRTAHGLKRLASRLLVSIAVVTLLAASGRSAHGQRIANQFDEQAAAATRGPQATAAERQAVDTSVSRPFIQKPVTRPDSWPSSKPRDASRVLSSIRSDPGSPLVPIDGPSPFVSGVVQTLAEVPLQEPDRGIDQATDPAGSGVVPAAFVEPARSAEAARGPAGGYPSTGLPPAAVAIDAANATAPAARVADGFSPAAASPTVDPLLSQAQPLQTAMVVARVGPEVVLESDLITPNIAEWLEKVTPGLKPEQVRELKMQLYQKMLTQYVESLLVYVDACRTIPEDALPEIETKVNTAFDTEQLPKMVAAAGVGSTLEYEQLLRSRGQSLDRIRKSFFERAIAQQWLQQAVDTDAGGEIPHADLIAYYQQHLADYEFPARATFEEMCVRFGARRTREEAWGILASLGNRVLSGEEFAAVAREASEGPTASQGGSYDWTSQGSLRSKVLDEALFNLPVGKLSTILEDGNGLHIIRVTERTEAGRTSFLDAQVEIREKLRMERHQKAIEDYLAKLRDRTPVWTIFDDESHAGVAGQPPQGL
jgi:parvulin-like peptidyl-prolyl isomerase